MLKWLPTVIALLLLALYEAASTTSPDFPPWQPPSETMIERGFTRFDKANPSRSPAFVPNAILSLRPPSSTGRYLYDSGRARVIRFEMPLKPTGNRPLDTDGLKAALSNIKLSPWSSSFTGWVLLGARALIVDVPSGQHPGFTHGEVLAIQSFIKAGGGLLIMGEHANSFYTSEVLAPLGAALGFKLEPVTVADEGRGGLARAIVKPGHPAAGQARMLDLHTSSALTVSSDWTVLAEGGDYLDFWDPERGEDADFTGNLKLGSEDRAGPGVVAAARSVGKGRVVVLADGSSWGGLYRNFLDNAAFFHSVIAWVGGGELAALAPPEIQISGEGCLKPGPEGFRALVGALARVADRVQCTGEGAGLVLQSGEKTVELLQSGQRATEEGTELHWKECGLGRPISHLALAEGLMVGGHFKPFILEESGLDVCAEDELGRPLVVRQGQQLRVLEPDLLSNRGMGGEKGDPARDAVGRAGWAVAIRLGGWLLDQ